MAKKKRQQHTPGVKVEGWTIASLPIVRILTTLWGILSSRQRAWLCVLVTVLLVSGFLEMGTILLIFGFVKGLNVGPDGHREGHLMKAVEGLSGTTFAHQEYMVFIGGGVLAALLFKSALSTSAEFALTRFLLKLTQRVAEGLFRGYLVAPFERLGAEDGSAGRIGGVFQLFSTCFTATARFISDAATVTMVVLVLFWINPMLTGTAVLLFAAAGGGLYRATQKLLKRLGREEKRANALGTSFLRDGLDGALETRLRDGRAHVARGYARALAREALVQRRADALGHLPKAVNELTLAAFVIISVFLLTTGGGSIADALPTLTIFGFAGLKMNGFVTRINRSLQKLRMKVELFEEQCANIRQVAPRILAQSDPGLPSYLKDEKKLRPGDDGRMRRQVELKNVHFKYPNAEAEVLSGVDMTITRGQFVGICGPSGGGKSTLALCLMGLVRPTEGELLFDGRSVFQHIRTWHKNIGYVGQQPYFSRRSIRENVAFAVPEEEIDDEQVWRVLRLAAAEEFVKDKPNGIHTKLRRAGRNLSGGQRQRLAIARALYHEPEVLILDEATAALDNATEREITRSIHELSGKKTVISIAHRLSTISGADRIFVVNRGKIEADGPYDTLVKTSALFASLAMASERTTEPCFDKP